MGRFAGCHGGRRDPMNGERPVTCPRMGRVALTPGGRADGDAVLFYVAFDSDWCRLRETDKRQEPDGPSRRKCRWVRDITLAGAPRNYCWFQ